MAETKTLLLLALAGGAGYYFYSKSSSTTPATTTTPAATDDWAATASGAATGGATLNPAANSLATAATSPALRDVPDDLAQLALKVSVDLATTVAVVKYDAIIYGHPSDLSTRYFLADAGSWQAAVQAYNQSGLAELAQKVGVDPATVLAVVALDAVTYNHPTQLSTQVFLNSPANWEAVYANYKAANGLSGLRGLSGGSESALSAVASMMTPAGAQAW